MRYGPQGSDTAIFRRRAPLWSALCATATGLLLGLGAAPATALSLEDAIVYVLETNPEITTAEANKQAIEFELDQARSFFAPRFELEAWAGSSYNDGTTTPDLTSATDPIEGYQFIGRVSQLLYDGYATRSEIERQAYRIDSAALRTLERAEFLSLEAIRAYADVLRTQQLVSLARQNLSYHRDVRDRLQRGFDTGVIPVGDLQQAEERIFLAEDTLIDFQLNAENFETGFLAIVGIEPTNLSAISSAGSNVPATLDAALATARRNNPNVLFSQADVGASEALMRQVDANRYPTLSLEADVRLGEDVSGYEGDVSEGRLGLVLRYDFQGGAKRAARQEQIKRVNESRARLLTQSRLVEREVRRSWSSLKAADRRAIALRSQAALARDLRGTYEKEYEVGLRSLLDVLNTQNALFQAEANLVNANSLRTFVGYRLLAASGTLLSSLGIEPPEDAKPYAREQQNAPGVNLSGGETQFDAKSFSDWRKAQR